MSLRPGKKSDADKSWNKPRRDKPRKMQIGQHLIITEGTKTEPLYFGALKENIKEKSGQDKVIVRGLGMNTTALFVFGKELSVKAGFPFEHIWLVYDKDDFPAEHFNKVAALCEAENKINEETTFHAIWSNQCIELWYLLHFSFFQSDIHRDEYYDKLDEQLRKIKAGAYKKNRDDMFMVLLPYLDNAIRNAEMLDEWNTGKTPAESAPGTQMHIMMKMFKPYI